VTATTPRLVHMANQIAVAFRNLGEEDAAAATFQHMRQFWDPRMRRLIVEHLESGGEELSAIARASVERLKAAS